MKHLLSQGLRRCYRCKQVKPLADFWASKSASGGRCYDCKECSGPFNAKYHREVYYPKNKVKVLESHRQWRKANPDKWHAANQVAWKTYYYKNHERVLALARAKNARYHAKLKGELSAS